MKGGDEQGAIGLGEDRADRSAVEKLVARRGNERVVFQPQQADLRGGNVETARLPVALEPARGGQFPGLEDAATPAHRLFGSHGKHPVRCDVDTVNRADGALVGRQRRQQRDGGPFAARRGLQKAQFVLRAVGEGRHDIAFDVDFAPRRAVVFQHHTEAADVHHAAAILRRAQTLRIPLVILRGKILQERFPFSHRRSIGACPLHTR